MPSLSLEQLTKAVKDLESRLFKLVLGSFLFSLVAAAAAYDTFDWPFKACRPTWIPRGNM